MTLRFLLHPERANRMIQQKSLDKNQLGLDEVFDLLASNFTKHHKDAYLSEIQQW